MTRAIETLRALSLLDAASCVAFLLTLGMLAMVTL